MLIDLTTDPIRIHQDHYSPRLVVRLPSLQDALATASVDGEHLESEDEVEEMGVPPFRTREFSFQVRDIFRQRGPIDLQWGALEAEELGQYKATLKQGRIEVLSATPDEVAVESVGTCVIRLYLPTGAIELQYLVSANELRETARVIQENIEFQAALGLEFNSPLADPTPPTPAPSIVTEAVDPSPPDPTPPPPNPTVWDRISNEP